MTTNSANAIGHALLSDNPALRAGAVDTIRTAIVRSRGNISATAASLGVARRTLHRWLSLEPDLAREAEALRHAAYLAWRQ